MQLISLRVQVQQQKKKKEKAYFIWVVVYDYEKSFSSNCLQSHAHLKQLLKVRGFSALIG